METSYLVILIIVLIVLIIYILAYKNAVKEIETIKDIDNKAIHKQANDAQKKINKMDDEITELKEKHEIELRNMEGNRNYYKKDRNKWKEKAKEFKELLLNYEGDERDLDKLDLLTNNKKGK